MSQNFRKAFVRGFIFFALFNPLFLSHLAAADEKLEEAFRSMLADLSDPEKSFNYAKLAAAQKEVWGAISALERLLLINPNLDNIRLELGTLYHRVGSYALAKKYIEDALASPDIPENVKKRARQYLTDTSRKASPHKFGGSLFLGGRYDSNVNFSPSSPDIELTSSDGSVRQLTLPEESTEQEDISTFANLNGRYDYALAGLSGHSFYVQSNLSGSWHDDRTDYDSQFASLELGFWMHDAPVGSRKFSFQPFITGGYLELDDEDYLSYAGGGITLQAYPTKRFSIALRTQYVEQDFRNTEIRTTAEEQSGDELDVSLLSSFQLGQRQRAYLQLVYTDDNADGADFDNDGDTDDTQSNNEWAGRLGYQVGFAGPFGYKARPWTTSIWFNYRKVEYDEIDTRVSAIEEREDDRFGSSISLGVPIAPKFEINLLIDYQDNDSNIENFVYDSTAVSLGLNISF